MTKEQKARLAQIRERISKARDERAQARQAVAAAEQLRDADAAALAQAKVDSVDGDLEYLGRLEVSALSEASYGDRVDRFGGTLANNLDAQTALGEIAQSSAPLRSNVAIGSIMAIDDVIGLTGGAIMAAPVNVPDSGGRADFFGITPTPQVPTSLLTSSRRCRSTVAPRTSCAVPASRTRRSRRTVRSSLKAR